MEIPKSKVLDCNGKETSISAESFYKIKGLLCNAFLDITENGTFMQSNDIKPNEKWHSNQLWSFVETNEKAKYKIYHYSNMSAEPGFLDAGDGARIFIQPEDLEESHPYYYNQIWELRPAVGGYKLYNFCKKDHEPGLLDCGSGKPFIQKADFKPNEQWYKNQVFEFTEYEYLEEIPDLSYEQRAKTICSCDNDDFRNGAWNMDYYRQWNCFPVKIMNETLDQMMQKMEKEPKMFEEVLNPQENRTKENISRCRQKIENKIAIESAKKLANTSGANQAAAKLAGKAVAATKEAVTLAYKNVMATEIVKYCVGGGAKQAGQGGARMAAANLFFKKTSEKFFASAGFKAFSHPGIGVASFAGELVADAITYQLGVEDKRICEAVKAAGGILACIATGAAIGCAGGPIGAAGGAVAGVASFALGQTIGALMRTGHGPNDNWCYLVTGDVDGKIVFGTYAQDDGVYAHTYAKKELGSNESDYFSAGQKQDVPFQVTVWDSAYMFTRTLAHFNEVYFRDTVFVSKVNGSYVVVLCRGGFSNRPGTTQRVFCEQNSNDKALQKIKENIPPCSNCKAKVTFADYFVGNDNYSQCISCGRFNQPGDKYYYCANNCNKWGFCEKCATEGKIIKGSCDIQSCAKCKRQSLKSFKYYGGNWNYKNCNGCKNEIMLNGFYWYCTACNTWGYCYKCTSSGKCGWNG